MSWDTVFEPDLTIDERRYIIDASAWAQRRARPLPAVIVHIGVGRGASLHCSQHGAPEAKLYGVDVIGAMELVMPCDATIITGVSQVAHQQFDQEIDLLVIDGDHSFYGVLGDVLGWCPLVRTGGVVIFHDYGNGRRCPWTAGVGQAVDSLGWGGWRRVAAPDSLAAFEKVGEDAQAGR